MKQPTAGYGAIHAYLRKHFPKTGICDECGEAASPTEYALIKGREYSRNREDYRELCKLCHNRYDEVGGSRWRGVVTAGMTAGESPSCACGCGESVLWDASHARWFRYLKGHRRSVGTKERGPHAAICDYCGDAFQARARNSRFCSPKCSAAERRASGKDDVERICHQCGSVFTANRYDATQHCSKSCSATCMHAGGCRLP